MEFDPLRFDRSVSHSFADMYPALECLRRENPALVAAFEEAVERAREFRAKHVEPNALKIDLLVAQEPTYIARDILEAACDYGLFTMPVPRIFGGQGMPFGALFLAMEEIGAGCLGIANLIGVHNLGYLFVLAYSNPRVFARVSRDVVAGERRRKPYLLSTGGTEPSAGSDMHVSENLRKARLDCVAKKVAGGFVLNGRKCFISIGSIADEHLVMIATDRQRPLETLATFFLIKTGTRGFSVGKTELKMGQKACPAVELVFEDCFIPDELYVGKDEDATKAFGLVLSGGTRGAVGTFGAAVARGALERAIAYCRSHRLGGKLMTEHQWVRIKLTEMLQNLMAARAVALEATFTNQLCGLGSLLMAPETRAAEWLLPRLPETLTRSRSVEGITTLTMGHLQKQIHAMPIESFRRLCGYGLGAKVLGSDLGMKNCGIAVELMGKDGLRHDMGMEKLYRDAKLLQIYEAPNAVCRLDQYAKMIEPLTGHEC